MRPRYPGVERRLRGKGLFKANAVNEEDPERDGTTRARMRRNVYLKLTQ